MMRFLRKLFTKKKTQAKFCYIPVGKIFQNPYQPRRIFNKEAMKQLENSIAKYGLLTPIIVRRLEGGYELVCGERRLRACKNLGFLTIPALIMKINTPQMLEIALTENIARADLLILEEADTYDRLRNEFTTRSDTNVANIIGLNKETLQKYKSLSHMPMILKKALLDGLVTEEQALCLAELKDENKVLEMLATTIYEKPPITKLKELIAQNL